MSYRVLVRKSHTFPSGGAAIYHIPQTVNTFNICHEVNELLAIILRVLFS